MQSSCRIFFLFQTVTGTIFRWSRRQKSRRWRSRARRPNRLPWHDRQNAARKNGTNATNHSVLPASMWTPWKKMVSKLFVSFSSVSKILLHPPIVRSAIIRLEITRADNGLYHFPDFRIHNVTNGTIIARILISISDAQLRLLFKLRESGYPHG